ncbi:MAG: TusE/DsrC/DsvC family sulfur relay protein [Myxococcota bacterium]|nr:TusE/DsrC/DsvC family sulfur relay protein [Myxococcota bacterium]
MDNAQELQAKVERLEDKVDRLTGLVEKLVERNERQSEMIDEAMPIAKEVMDWATVKLDDAEKAGWFALSREAFGVVEAVVEAYEPEDVRALGDSMVTILEAVRSFTQPEVMAMLAEAGEVIQHGDELEPVTPLEVVKAGRDPEVQRGLAVMVEVLRQVGRATKTMHPERQDDGGKARRKRLLNRRSAPTGGYRSMATRPPVEAVKSAAPAPKPAAPSQVIELPGFELDGEGYLADPGSWSREYAAAMAAAMGVPELGEGHWKVIEYARSRWQETGSSPNIRAITVGAGISTKELYALFPVAPGTTTARVAGIPKPVGCI